MSKLTQEQRFWKKVDKRGPDECWGWRGYKTPLGYGQFQNFGGKGHTYAHRISYKIAHGHIQQDMIVRHSCDNPGCVNPAHLLLGTHKDNTMDMIERKRNLSCVGENNNLAKLSAEKVIEIRKRFSGGEKNKFLAKEYGVSISTISSVCHKQTWKHIS